MHNLFQASHIRTAVLSRNVSKARFLICTQALNEEANRGRRIDYELRDEVACWNWFLVKSF